APSTEDRRHGQSMGAPSSWRQDWQLSQWPDKHGSNGSQLNQNGSQTLGVTYDEDLFLLGSKPQKQKRRELEDLENRAKGTDGHNVVGPGASSKPESRSSWNSPVEGCSLRVCSGRNDS